MRYRFKGGGMNQLFIAMLLCCISVMFAACAGTNPDGSSTLGDGKVDQVEAASIRVAVGLAFTAKPEAVVPAYGVSTAVLAVLPPGEGAEIDVSLIDTVIGAELDKLNLDQPTRQSFDDLVLLARAKISEQLAKGTAGNQRLVVVREVVAIIQQTAASRLEVASK